MDDRFIWINSIAAVDHRTFPEGGFMKKWRVSITFLIVCILLTGCWSSTPVEELSMEIGVALDSAEETGDEEATQQGGGGILCLPK